MISLTQIITWTIALLAPIIAAFIALLIFSKGAWKVNSSVSFKNICYGVMHNPPDDGLMIVKDFKVDTTYQDENSEVYYNIENFRMSGHVIFEDLELYLAGLKLYSSYFAVQDSIEDWDGFSENECFYDTEQLLSESVDFKNIEIVDISLRNSGRIASLIKPPQVRLEINGKTFHPKISPIFIHSDTINPNKNGSGKLEPGDSITYSYSLYEIFLWSNNLFENIDSKSYNITIDTPKEFISNKKLAIILSLGQRSNAFLKKINLHSSKILSKNNSKIKKINIVTNKIIKNLSAYFINQIENFFPRYIKHKHEKKHDQRILKFEYESSNKNKQVTHKKNNWALSSHQFKMFSYNDVSKKQMKENNIFPRYKNNDFGMYIEDIHNPLIFKMVYFSITQEIFAAIAHENIKGLSYNLSLEDIVKFTTIYRDIITTNLTIYKEQNPEENDYTWYPSDEEKTILKTYIKNKMDRTRFLKAINDALSYSNQKFEADAFYLGTTDY